MLKEIQEELKNNEVLKAIERDYEDEVGSLSSDGEVADEMEIDNQPIQVADSVKQIEWNGDIEMKQQQERPKLDTNIFLGGYPLWNPCMKLAELTQEIDKF